MSINEHVLITPVTDFHHTCRNCSSKNTYVNSEKFSITKSGKRIITYSFICIECFHLSWARKEASEDYYVPEEHGAINE